MSVREDTVQALMRALIEMTDYAPHRKWCGEVWYETFGMDDLGARVGVSDCTARKALRELQRRGRIQVSQRHCVTFRIPNSAICLRPPTRRARAVTERQDQTTARAGGEGTEG